MFPPSRCLHFTCLDGWIDATAKEEIDAIRKTGRCLLCFATSWSAKSAENSDKSKGQNIETLNKRICVDTFTFL